MNSVSHLPRPHAESSLHNHLAPIDPEYRKVMLSAMQVLDQPPPPSLREILGAYKAKGDGDRDMLIAMLNAKSAEDQRIASVAALHKTALEISVHDIKPQYPPHPPSSHANGSRHHRYPSDLSSGRASPGHVQELPSMTIQPPRKRQRSSRSPSRRDVQPPHTSLRDLPPSPYSARSNSEEYSPRSRASMAIGSLLSTGGSRENGEERQPTPPSAPQ